VVTGDRGPNGERIAFLEYNGGTEDLEVVRWGSDARASERFFDPPVLNVDDPTCDTLTLNPVALGDERCLVVQFNNKFEVAGRNGGTLCDLDGGADFAGFTLSEQLGDAGLTGSPRTNPIHVLDLNHDGLAEVWMSTVLDPTLPDPDLFVEGYQCTHPSDCERLAVSDLFEDDGRVSGLSEVYAMMALGPYLVLVGGGAHTLGPNPTSVWKWSPATHTYSPLRGVLSLDVSSGLDPAVYTPEQAIQRMQPMGAAFFTRGEHVYLTVTSNVHVDFLVDPHQPSNLIEEVTKLFTFHLGPLADLLADDLHAHDLSAEVRLSTPTRTDSPTTLFTPWGINTQLPGILLVAHAPDQGGLGGAPTDLAPEGVVAYGMDTWLLSEEGHLAPHHSPVSFPSLTHDAFATDGQGICLADLTGDAVPDAFMDGVYDQPARLLVGEVLRTDPIIQVTVRDVLGNPPTLTLSYDPPLTHVFSSAGPGGRGLEGMGVWQAWFTLPPGQEVGGEPGVEAVVRWDDGAESSFTLREGENTIAP